MQILIAVIIGGIFACAIYMILRRSIVKLIIGLALLGHAANLLIFSAGGLSRGSPALVLPGATAPPEPYADPLPQALILTAIVISFGVIAFMMVLVSRAYNAVGTDDTDELVSTDR